MFYVVTCVAIKASIAISLLRVTVNRIHNYILYAVVALSIANGLLLLMVTIFQCNPVPYFWLRASLKGLTMHGKCLHVQMVLQIVYVYSAFAALTDFTIGLLPFFIIWKLRMATSSKIALVCILGLGCM